MWRCKACIDEGMHLELLALLPVSSFELHHQVLSLVKVPEHVIRQAACEGRVHEKSPPISQAAPSLRSLQEAGEKELLVEEALQGADREDLQEMQKQSTRWR